MKQSFSKKIQIFTAFSIALTIIVCWLLNSAFLEKYYIDSRKELIRQTFAYINQSIPVLDEDTLSEEQRSILDRQQANNNVDIYIFTEVEKTTPFGTMFYTYFTYPQNATLNDKSKVEGGPGANTAENRAMSKIVESYLYYVFPRVHSVIKDVKTIEETDNYRIMSQHDTSVDSDYMDIYGKLDCGYYCFVRVSLESLGEAAKIANKFLFMIGITMIIFSTVFASFFGKRLTKPIMELSDLAKRMSKLDFNVKYESDADDEIGVLGNSMNTLSGTLEKTISELKSANLELQSDIERKTEIDNMRTEFLSNVTHELKTPIAIIQGYAEGLKDCINDDPESRNFYCDVIIDEAAKMNKMVKNLLSLNKIESGGIPLEINRFNLRDVVKSVLEASDILFKRSEAELVFDDAQNTMIWADEYMVEEVVTNYISNALNHVAGEKKIEIKIEEKDGIARFSVFNTGEPIPEEELDKIWIKFYKVDKARTREYGGTGIGLSIVKAIMEAHHRNYGVINHSNGVEFWAEFDCSEK